MAERLWDRVIAQITDRPQTDTERIEIMEFRTYNETQEYLEEANVKFIRLAFFDAFGIQKNIAIMPQQLGRALNEGISFDASVVAGFEEEIQTDLFLKPDLSTLTIVPWRPTDGRVMRVFCDVQTPEGNPCTNDTRYILKQAVAHAQQAGVRIAVGPELEFYVFKCDEQGNRTKTPLDQGSYMDVDPLDKGDNIRRDICFALLDMGITPEASHHEAGPGQNEIDFRYSNPLSAADNTVTVRWAISSIAESSGNWADLSPKPLHDKPGNGMHINLSVEMNDGEDHQAQFMAGIMKYIREITLFLNPLPASYERFGRMEAPRYVSWSRQNRSQLIRIPASTGGRKRMELRSPDPSANPYLALALLIEAGLEGIRDNLDPGEPLNVNLFHANHEITSKLASLPENIEEAIHLAKNSEFVRKYVPENVLRAYTERKFEQR